MAANPSLSFMNSDFEDFLFASIGEQQNGMPVSLFSALARLDIDPWGEAKRLTEMPRDRAIQALRGSIDRSIGMEAGKIDAAGIAVRLIGLLPRQGIRIQIPDSVAKTTTPRRTLPVIPPDLLSKASQLPLSVWLVLGAAVLLAIYVIMPSGNVSEWTPSSYDTPVDQKRR